VLAKLTSKNQLTLPKSILLAFPNAKYFEVEQQGSKIVLTAVQIQNVDSVRDKISKLGITETDVQDAVKWARRKK
jgi:hypothetical protein